MDPYLELLLLVAGLFFVPKALLRLRVPPPLTELALGVLLGPVVLGWIEPRDALRGLSGFGISALFLFAGLEVELPELRERAGTLRVHLLIQTLLVAIAAWVGTAFGLDLGAAVLVGAAVMSPSVGYIVAALEAWPVDPELASWIKQKAVAAELLAIALVLVFSNAGSWLDLGLGIGMMLGLLLLVPLLIAVFHRAILPTAPNTEMPFLLVIGLLAAYASHHVGMHYLAGSFLVGLIARRYLDRLRGERTGAASVAQALTAFRFFASFFVPFFFFVVGLELPPGALTRQAVLFAGGLFLAALPLRIVPALLHRRLGLREGWPEAVRVGLFLMPTTVFTLAVAELLRERFDIAPWVYGGLIVYGAATSLVPAFSPAGSVERGDEIVAVASDELLERR